MNEFAGFDKTLPGRKLKKNHMRFPRRTSEPPERSSRPCMNVHSHELPIVFTTIVFRSSSSRRVFAAPGSGTTSPGLSGACTLSLSRGQRPANFSRSENTVERGD
ncbi:hypothetical protein MRX96_033844 [Rhipicephalus microplus]